MTGDVFTTVLREGRSLHVQDYGLGMHTVDDQGKHYVSQIVNSNYAWVEQSPWEALICELRALHKPETREKYLWNGVMYQRTNVQVCEHCVSLCHSRSGLSCDEPYDAPWPCDTLQIIDRLFPSAT